MYTSHCASIGAHTDAVYDTPDMHATSQVSNTPRQPDKDRHSCGVRAVLNADLFASLAAGQFRFTEQNGKQVPRCDGPRPYFLTAPTRTWYSDEDVTSYSILIHAMITSWWQDSVHSTNTACFIDDHSGAQRRVLEHLGVSGTEVLKYVIPCHCILCRCWLALARGEPHL